MHSVYLHGSVTVISVVERGRSQFWWEAEFPKTECSALVHQDGDANSSQKLDKTKGGEGRWRRKRRKRRRRRRGMRKRRGRVEEKTEEKKKEKDEKDEKE